MEVHNFASGVSGSASELLPAACGVDPLKSEQLPSQRHRFIRTKRNHHQLHELLVAIVFLARNPHEINVSQLNGSRYR